MITEDEGVLVRYAHISPAGAIPAAGPLNNIHIRIEKERGSSFFFVRGIYSEPVRYRLHTQIRCTG